VEFLQDYTFILKHKTDVENKVADALSRRVMTLVTMSTEVIGFERLREEYDSCPDFEKNMSRYETALFVKCTIFFYKTVIYSDSVSYVFSVRLSGIFSLEKYMLEVWLDISVRLRQTLILLAEFEK